MMDMTHEKVIIELHACLLKVYETTVFTLLGGKNDSLIVKKVYA